jgi:hypothetical protein
VSNNIAANAVKAAQEQFRKEVKHAEITTG